MRHFLNICYNTPPKWNFLPEPRIFSFEVSHLQHGWTLVIFKICHIDILLTCFFYLPRLLVFCWSLFFPYLEQVVVYFWRLENNIFFISFVIAVNPTQTHGIEFNSILARLQNVSKTFGGSMRRKHFYPLPQAFSSTFFSSTFLEMSRRKHKGATYFHPVPSHLHHQSHPFFWEFVSIILKSLWDLQREMYKKKYFVHSPKK